MWCSDCCALIWQPLVFSQVQRQQRTAYCAFKISLCCQPRQQPLDSHKPIAHPCARGWMNSQQPSVTVQTSCNTLYVVEPQASKKAVLSQAHHSTVLSTSACCTYRVHTQRYVEYIQALSKDSSKGIHRAGEDLAFGPGAQQHQQLKPRTLQQKWWCHSGGCVTLSQTAQQH